MASFLSSIRYLLADVLGDDETDPPGLPANLPAEAADVVQDGIGLLIAYQGPSYAQLYVERVRRFVKRGDVEPLLLREIAVLLAERMSYQDPIRIAQLKLMTGGGDGSREDEVRSFTLDELIGALPATIAEPIMDVLGRIGWLHRQISIRFSDRTPLHRQRLRIEAGLRRWRLFSVHYAAERLWVERWLHMIARCLDKQPSSVMAVVQTATMIRGHGDRYRQGLADWHAIIDGLAKPTFDGVLPIPDLAAAITEARAACMPDPRQASLKRCIAQLRSRALTPQVLVG